MQYVYKTTGTCSRNIYLEIEDGIIKQVEFEGGCSGNTQGLAKMVQGLGATEVINKLKGIRCGVRPTSCPDQLAQALQQYLNEK